MQRTEAVGGYSRGETAAAAAMRSAPADMVSRFSARGEVPTAGRKGRWLAEEKALVVTETKGGEDEMSPGAELKRKPSGPDEARAIPGDVLAPNNRVYA